MAAWRKFAWNILLFCENKTKKQHKILSKYVEEPFKKKQKRMEREQNKIFCSLGKQDTLWKQQVVDGGF